MTKIYIASFFDTRERLKPYAAQLKSLGYTVLDRWINEPDGEAARLSMTHDEHFRHCALRDYFDMDHSDLVIIDTFDITPRGGREWEAGYMVGKGKPSIRVGPVRNVYHTVVDIAFDNWEDLIASMRPLNG